MIGQGRVVDNNIVWCNGILFCIGFQVFFEMRYVYIFQEEEYLEQCQIYVQDLGMNKFYLQS